MAQTTLRQVPALIAERKAFKGNSITAQTYEPGQCYAAPGRLNDQERHTLNADVRHIVYIVKSYDTPIAWVKADGTVHRVAQKFSVTTSKHQGRLYTL